MCTLVGDQPVIPSVTFIYWSPSIPYYSEGSLCPTYVSVRLIGLSVKYAFCHYACYNLSLVVWLLFKLLAIPFKLKLYILFNTTLTKYAYATKYWLHKEIYVYKKYIYIRIYTFFQKSIFNYNFIFIKAVYKYFFLYSTQLILSTTNSFFMLELLLPL